MIKKRIYFYEYDDYRFGHKINIIEESEFDETFVGHCYTTLEFNDKYRVYVGNVEFNTEFETTFLKEFDNEDDANFYARCQYKLFTGENPFITTGRTSATGTTGPIGDRNKLKIPKTIKKDIKYKNTDSNVLFMIITSITPPDDPDGIVVRTHSLDVYTQW